MQDVELDHQRRRYVYAVERLLDQARSAQAERDELVRMTNEYEREHAVRRCARSTRRPARRHRPLEVDCRTNARGPASLPPRNGRNRKGNPMKKKPPTHAGQRLRDARLAARLSQEDLAAAIGTHQKLISKIENRTNLDRTTAGVLYRICQRLGVSLDELMANGDQNS